MFTMAQSSQGVVGTFRFQVLEGDISSGACAKTIGQTYHSTLVILGDVWRNSRIINC